MVIKMSPSTLTIFILSQKTLWSSKCLHPPWLLSSSVTKPYGHQNVSILDYCHPRSQNLNYGHQNFSILLDYCHPQSQNLMVIKTSPSSLTIVILSHKTLWSSKCLCLPWLLSSSEVKKTYGHQNFSVFLDYCHLQSQNLMVIKTSPSSLTIVIFSHKPYGHQNFCLPWLLSSSEVKKPYGHQNFSVFLDYCHPLK